MNKNIISAVVVILALFIISGSVWYSSINGDDAVSQVGDTNTNGDVMFDQNKVDPIIGTHTKPDAEGKLKADTFSGKLEVVDVGCFVDGECFVVVDGRHVTTTMGWSQEIVGTVEGVESFGDLEGHIGEEVLVYAHDRGDGTYTLYGSEGFYVKLK